MKSGIEIIADERQRQIVKKGYTLEHDKQHTHEELLKVARLYIRAAEACCYPKNCIDYNGGFRAGEGVPSDYPNTWNHGYWKPSDDPIRNLAKAGGMLAAEIDRLQGLQSEQSNTETIERAPDEFEKFLMKEIASAEMDLELSKNDENYNDDTIAASLATMRYILARYNSGLIGATIESTESENENNSFNELLVLLKPFIEEAQFQPKVGYLKSENWKRLREKYLEITGNRD